MDSAGANATGRSYPHIISCRNCGTRTVPVPLDRYPVPVDDLVRAMDAVSACPACGGTELVMDQSEDAYRWYDETQR